MDMMFRSEPVSGLAKCSLLSTRILMALGTNRRPTRYFCTARGTNPCCSLDPAVCIAGTELYVIVDAGTGDQVLARTGSFNESSEAVSEPHRLFDSGCAGHEFSDVNRGEYE